MVHGMVAACVAAKQIQGLTVKGKEEHILQKQEKQQNCDAQRHCVSPKIVETLHL